MKKRIFSFTTLLLMIPVLLITACSQQKQRDITGVYRGVLHSPGGDLAFPITINKNNGSYTGYVTNGADTVKFTSVVLKGDSLHMNFNFYDSHIDAKIGPKGNLTGRWHKRYVENTQRVMKFTAAKGVKERYPRSSSDTKVFNGQWPTVFENSSGHTYNATGEFYTKDHQLYGTFMTKSGDFRYLEGTYTDSTLTLSTFDGAHAYLLKGKLQKDGTLKGKNYEYSSSAVSWTSHKGENQLPDPFKIEKIDPQHPKITFALKDLNGDTVRSTDDQFKNKPIMLYIFGSWCPNCADEAHMLRQMYNKYKNTDLRVVGVAYEYTDNYNTAVKLVKNYKKRFNIPWTLLVAGRNEANIVKKTLPFIKNLYSYPTTYFSDTDHNIKFIHVGFYGPGTGAYYLKEKQVFKEKLDSITQ
ncbi:MAG TPA: TlpA disulfide reductase family protein [Balneolales bacterium]|nr:TlpA disulfide reductase family protein [Balneolales bacterium]